MRSLHRGHAGAHRGADESGLGAVVLVGAGLLANHPHRGAATGAADGRRIAAITNAAICRSGTRLGASLTVVAAAHAFSKGFDRV